jgi:hypothetical protein
MTGILNQERQSIGAAFFVFPATLSRDVIRLDNSETRYESETLELPPSPGGFLSGGLVPYYVAVRAENNLLAALPKATSELSTGDTAAVGGLVRTLKANDLYAVLATRDSLGIPVNVSDPTTIAPILCKPKVLAALSAILDSGYAELQNAQQKGTTTFPVALPSGYTSVGGDYSQIDNLIRFNRGIAGKIKVYSGLSGGGTADFTAAVTDLNIALAGITPSAATLAGGPYYQFSTASGETSNPLFDSRIHFQPSVMDSIQPGDKRISKIVTRADTATLTVDGVPFKSLYDPAVTVTSNSANQTRPIPILKNEELYLLRAQAEIGLNDLAAATADLNIVRTISGGLAPYAVFADQASAINALLYEKRYSLLTDGGQRLVDLRAYGRLNATTFPAGSQLSPFPNDPFNKVLPYPQTEIDARGGNLTCQ